MNRFDAMRLPSDPTVLAPDGSEVRVLLGLTGGSMAHFHLAAGHVARAIAHKTVEEIWFVLSGRGRMWRRQGNQEEVVALQAGVCLTIPCGAQFQFRADRDEGVSIIGITMPPWPGDAEAVFVEGPWQPTA